MPPKVIVRKLQKRYGGVQAVRGVSFAVASGEIFGLLGPNGAGKTTVLECILGLREPDAGTIEVCGYDAQRQPHAVKQKVGAVLQMTALQDKITPREALQLFGSFFQHSDPPEELLTRFALSDKADVAFDALSGGQQQRLALALAFVNKPEVVFLDEPTTGLDPSSRRALHDDIERMKRDGHTVLLTTHYMEEAERLCDRVALIDRGRIVTAGTPGDLIEGLCKAPSLSFKTTRPIARLLLMALPGVHDVDEKGTHIRLRTSTVRRTLAELMELLEAHEIELAELHVQTATLEDVLIERTQ